MLLPQRTKQQIDEVHSSSDTMLCTDTELANAHAMPMARIGRTLLLLALCN